jgi:hypothetical protein
MSQAPALSSSPTRLISYKQCVWSLKVGRRSLTTPFGTAGVIRAFCLNLTRRMSSQQCFHRLAFQLWFYSTICLSFSSSTSHSFACMLLLFYKVIFDCMRIRSQLYKSPKTINDKSAYKVESTPQLPWFPLWQLFDLEPINEHGTRVYCIL